jgi:hypothetical protein
MDTNSQMQQPFSADVPTHSLEDASPFSAQADANVARSENNILQWMSYLPQDCIRTMIDMGWDVTT